MYKNRNVFWLGIVSFFTDLSSDMIFPVLPVFLSSVLGVPKAMIGLIDGLGEAVASFLKAGSGIWSDRIHRRKWLVVLGYGLSTMVKPFFALIRTGPQALALRVIERAGKGIRTAPRDALITESVKDTERGRAFGFQRALDTSGAVLGTLVAFLFLWYAADGGGQAPALQSDSPYRTLFMLSFIPGAIAVILLFIFVREPPSPRFHLPPESGKGITEIDAIAPISVQRFKRFLMVSALFHLASASYSFFILKAHDIGIGLAFVPLVYLVYSLIYALLSKPMGQWSDKIGRHKVLPLGFIAFAATAAGFAFVNSVWVWLFIALYGVSLAVTDGVSRAYVADLVSGNPSQPPLTLRGGGDRNPPLKVRGGRGSYEHHGAAFGAYHMTTGLAALAGATIFGLLWDRFGAQTAFLFSAILSIVSTILFIVFFNKRSSSK